MGADPHTYHSAERFYRKDWTVRETLAAYRAEDVKPFAIKAFLEKWDRAPLSPDKEEKFRTDLQANHPSQFFQTGNRLVHPVMGFGTVLDAIVCDENKQKLYILFDSGVEDVFDNTWFCKVAGGSVA